jgi:class I fructose-bisphosphate aldolase
MNVGKLVRLHRLFSHPSGRLCSIAVDHFIGYERDMPSALRQVQATIAAVVAARPSAVTLYPGLAETVWKPFAGLVPLIVQSTIDRSDDSVYEQVATAGDAVRLGAEALAVVAYVRGRSEARNLGVVADCVRQAVRYELPVVCHIYPRDERDLNVISKTPEDVAWAVRCAVEVGVDIIKAPYCGDVAAQAQIVQDCPLPLVVAGGPKQRTLQGALDMMGDVVRSGAKGATIGRNAWGHSDITMAVRAFKAVIQDEATTAEALRIAGRGR